MKLLVSRALVGALLGAAAGLASAQDMTGAGATFPAPIYAKWADAYNKATGARLNYQSVGPAPASSRSAPRPSTSALPTCRSPTTRSPRTA
jgi:ABC-type phosphate transport system substrate-binding protein